MSKNHPFEIAISGFSNAGKTVLTSKLIKYLTPKFDIGYLKNSHCRRNWNKTVKDTDLILNSKATYVGISSPNYFCIGSKQKLYGLNRNEFFLDSDILFIEGFKYSEFPKILVLDKEKVILKEYLEGKIKNVIAFVGREEIRHPKIPWFQIDDINSIAKKIIDFLDSNKPPIRGLVLTGGHSLRMKKEKALLKYKSKTQVEEVFELLSSFCDTVYISAREDQYLRWPNHLKKLPVIKDKLVGCGPIGGILSAQIFDSSKALLVVACDLPNLTDKTISYLKAHRNPFKFCTHFLNFDEEFPEPLCSIYEPKSKMKLFKLVSQNQFRLKFFLENVNTQKLTLPYPEELFNVNTPRDMPVLHKV